MLKHRKVCKLQDTLPKLPTKKQIEFAKEIQEVLGLKDGPLVPGTLSETREAYSKYISKYIDVYAVHTADTWILDHGYF